MISESTARTQKVLRATVFLAVPLGIGIVVLVTWAAPVLQGFRIDLVHADLSVALVPSVPFLAVALLAWRRLRRLQLTPAAVRGVIAALATCALVTLTATLLVRWAMASGRYGAAHLGVSLLSPLLALLLVPVIDRAAGGAGRTERIEGPAAGSARKTSTVSPWVRWLGNAVLVVLVIAVVGPILAGLVFVFPTLQSVRAAEMYLQRPEVYEPVARTLALYLQSEDGLIPKSFSPRYLPQPLADRNRGRGLLGDTWAGVEMGGGFHHLGYRMSLDEEGSDSTTRRWELRFHSEESTDRLLLSITLPVSACVTRDQLAAQLTESYSAWIAKNPDDDLAHIGAMQASLRLDRLADALEVCDRWVAMRPDTSVPRFARAHVMARLGHLDEATSSYSSWTAANPSFERYIYLFLFHMREGRRSDALSSIRRAIEQRPAGATDWRFNASTLAYDAAVFAFLSGEPELAAAVCDRAIAGSESARWHHRFIRLKAACLTIMGDASAARDLFQTLVGEGRAPGDSVAGEGCVAWEGLRAQREHDDQYEVALREGDTAFLRAFASWKEDVHDWTNPLDEDDTHIRGGSSDRLPQPFPDSWSESAGF